LTQKVADVGTGAIGCTPHQLREVLIAQFPRVGFYRRHVSSCDRGHYRFVVQVTLPRADVTLLRDDVADAASAILTVDLRAQTITRASGNSIAFGIEPGRKSQLLQGLDEISVTLQELDAIEAFERERSRLYPWL